MSKESETKSLNFIEEIIEKDLAAGKYPTIQTRFPPEPNGFLHIGHSKAININFGLAEKYGGECNLRFDDTNPEKEDTEYVEAIRSDIKWLGYSWENEYFTSDYFEQIYKYAIDLIQQGKAYIDEQDAETIAKQKGTPIKAGTESPYRNRPIEESLDLFKRMRAGEFEEGSMILRAKIDMTSPNMKMRDPFIYRIKKVAHHRTGDTWNIYPLYEFAHEVSDSIENITHSLCSLEFKDHNPVYVWVLDQLGTFPSRQYEFARLNLSYTIMSKRKLLRLIEENFVDGWDDPRMPTISGLRRRGYTPEAIRNFVESVGVAKRENVIDVSKLEFYVREHLNKVANRVMTVLNPLKVIITNYPADKTEELETENNQEDASAGTRKIPFSREIYIEKEDFRPEAPNRKYKRLAVGKAVRLKSAYIIECEDFLQDEETGEIKEVYCKYYKNSKSGQDTSGIKAGTTMHWVSAKDAIDVEVRLYDRLFSDPAPDSHKDKETGETKDFVEFINPDSLQILENCKAEPSLKDAEKGDRFQFLRLGYFAVDSKYTTEEKLVFNRTVALRDTWAKKDNSKQNQGKKKS